MRKVIRKRFSILFMICVLVCAFLSAPLKAAAREKSEVDEIISSIPSDWPNAPEIGARAAVLLDAQSGEILYAKNATEMMYPASTTKLMTALLTLENCSLQDIVDFDFNAINIPPGSSHVGMRRGEQMVLRECLISLLLPSANEVANALAQHTAGTISNFVLMMNDRAKQLGAVNTAFTNPNGLHDEAHYTCAYDLALIMRACVQNTTFVEIASMQSYVHHADELLNKDIPMTNTNMMIRPSSEYYNEYVVLGKTGHTEESGYNLVTYAEKDGTSLICVVMGCESGNQYVSTQSLLDYGLNYFHTVLPAELDQSLSMESAFTGSPIALPTPEISLLSLDTTESILLPDNVTFDQLDKECVITDSGMLINYSYEGYPLGTVTLNNTSNEETHPLFVKKDTSALQVTEVPDLALVDGWILVSLAVLTVFLVLFIRVIARMTLPKKRFTIS